LIGNGKDENEIKSFISVHQLNAKVFNSKKDIYNYYQLIDVYVLPSRIEPFGIVILEAAIMKKPVVASNVDGIPELIDHEINGLLFEPENIDDLITKIIKILDNPKLKNEYVQNLYRKVMDTFTTEKTIPLFERVYRDVIK
jgi:glycosyltransferase involved in cell wall biosynthesis